MACITFGLVLLRKSSDFLRNDFLRSSLCSRNLVQINLCSPFIYEDFAMDKLLAPLDCRFRNCLKSNRMYASFSVIVNLRENFMLDSIQSGVDANISLLGA